MVRRFLLRLSAALLVLMLAAQPAAASGPSRFFIAFLWGGEENPPVATRTVGLGLFLLNRSETALGFKLFVAKGEGVTQAHIHCGAPGVNGPVVAFLYALNPLGTDVNGLLSEGVLLAVNVIPRPASDLCPGGVANLAEMIAKMRTDGAYANVHTLDNPGGEIRGSILAK